MTSTNTTYTRAQPTAPSNNLCVPAETRDYVPTAEYTPTQVQDLQRLFDYLAVPLDHALEWINNHFAVSPPITSGRTTTPDTSTLRAKSDGSRLTTEGRVGYGQPLTVAIPSSAISSSMTGAVVFMVPLAAAIRLKGIAVVASSAPSGSGSIKVASLTANIGSSVTYAAPSDNALPITYNAGSAVPVLITTSSGWSLTGTVYVTIYLRWV